MRISDWSSDVCSADLRAILVDCLSGSNGREKVESWLPKWFAFPPTGCTERGGIGCVERSERIAPLLVPAEAEDEPEMRHEIGSASCRERLCKYVKISVVGGPIKKKTKRKQDNR